MGTFGRCGQWEHTIGLLVSMRLAVILPNLLTYSAVVSACARAGQWLQALGHLAAMRSDDVMPQVNSWDNISFYKAAISVCDTAEIWRHGFWIFEDMQKHDLQPNVVTYNVGIRALAKSDQWRQALELHEFGIMGLCQM
eukprot:TRINITY_DN11818_c0_g1_i1.p1 TRINITY_DN11818_c0_g1~~TRINITY_DN11818_c0_g1_i1.p1  ORF type:complete len:139 (+),score=16.86 TRINITY_DN11818_c0_g1_i1:133-549(+)